MADVVFGPKTLEEASYSHLHPCVSSVIGKLINCPDEDEPTRLSKINVTDEIIRISNNYGDKQHPKHKFDLKEKKNTSRVTPGLGPYAGTHFQSQTTYTVYEIGRAHV